MKRTRKNKASKPKKLTNNLRKLARYEKLYKKIQNNYDPQDAQWGGWAKDISEVRQLAAKLGRPTPPILS